VILITVPCKGPQNTYLDGHILQSHRVSLNNPDVRNLATVEYRLLIVH